ncbi:DUF2336 domain-containing protein [Afipia sp. GAS231]|uniref:DUF2336 domain-containing protein n=1 Tax=Afipia sp. GAS231 TaxID=1882747 RepID=UPI00087DDB46|nr:DUF2336 domain-containing protein [Afipia sp. GAS231]SDN59905.1 Uncharacterized conserved protein, DUF2336 family [Afipia sp. GAS231]
MTKANPFLNELDAVVSRGTPESRARALWHTTDLMIAGHHSEDEIWTLGAVIGRLADEIEVAARAQLAERLARFNDAPVNVIHKLAFDDSIDVAGPVLKESEKLEPYAMVANVCLKSQSHLLAISKRESLVEMVTDVLVTRGDQEVVTSVASNKGARFSESGFRHMIEQAENDSVLAERLGLRQDIPRHVFEQLVAKASDEVKKRLQRERPDMVKPIQSTLANVASELQSKLGPTSKSYASAKQAVTALHRQGKLNENSISSYARTRKLEEVTIGLSLLCALPEDLIERALSDTNRETLLTLARAHRFSWDTTMSLLFLGARDHRIGSTELKDLKDEFGRLNIETSRGVLKSYQSRNNPGDANPGEKRQPALAVR